MRKTPKKLLSFVLALVMILTSLTAGLSAFAKADYSKNNIEYNYLDWSCLTYEQQCSALLDYLDLVLAKANISMDVVISIDLRSVDKALDSIGGLSTLAGMFSWMMGDLNGIKLDSVKKGARRSNG
ncbi:MAG: hypothetical protein K5917_06230, partial [Clostridiales bacterium]|nr:hypothetical protein [Clostridiales bacterium]